MRLQKYCLLACMVVFGACASSDKDFEAFKPQFKSFEVERELLVTGSDDRRAVAASRLEGDDPKVAVPLLFARLLKEPDEITAKFPIANSLSAFEESADLVVRALNSTKDQSSRHRLVWALPRYPKPPLDNFLSDTIPTCGGCTQAKFGV